MTAPVDNEDLFRWLDHGLKLPEQELIALEERLRRDPAVADLMASMASIDGTAKKILLPTQDHFADQVLEAVRATVDRRFVSRTMRSVSRISDRNSRNRSSNRRLESTAFHRAWLIPIAASMILGVLVYLLNSKGPSVTVIARVEAAGANAVLVRDGQTIAATAAAEIREGDRLRVPGGSSATIAYMDGTQLDFSDGSDANFVKANQSRARSGKYVFLEQGSLNASVSKQPAGKPMLIATPNAEAVVVGTMFTLTASVDRTRLEVSEGLVQLIRSADNAVTDVSAGHYAIAAVGIDLVQQPLSAVSRLLHLDFEDGETSAEWIGKIVPGPQRAGNRGCLAGQFVPENQITRAKVVDDKNGIFTYDEGSVLTFDYWVGDEVVALDVFVWDATQQAGIGNFTLWSLTHNQWSRATLLLSELKDESGQRLDDGDHILSLTIQTNEGDLPLFIDNIDVARPREK
jgi:hypothetical protein